MTAFQQQQTLVFAGRVPGRALLVLLVAQLIMSLANCGPLQQQPPKAAGKSVPPFSHIFIIVLENREYPTIVGNPQAPYLNSLSKTYALATQYFAIGHPSLLNYLALTGGSTFGLHSNCATCFQQASNLPDQLEASGHTWKAYLENMPAPCYVGDTSNGLYEQAHNPFVYYDDIRLNTSRCATHVVPFTQFPLDLSADHLPDYVWITPNLCHDMAHCSVASGDLWLSQVVPTLLHSTAFTHGGVLFITFDEGKTNAGCCNSAAGGHIATLVISPMVKKGWQSNNPESHYSLLRTIEEAWRLPPLGEAGKSMAMTEYFTNQ